MTPEKKQPVISAEEAVVFADMVKPILEKKCESCHNNKKAKVVYINHKIVSKTRQFSISLWINTNCSTMREETIPLLQSNDTPFLLHAYNSALKENTFTVNINGFFDANDCIFTLPMQKWNQIVITYDGNILLIYCNIFVYNLSLS